MKIGNFQTILEIVCCGIFYDFLAVLTDQTSQRSSRAPQLASRECMMDHSTIFDLMYGPNYYKLHYMMHRIGCENTSITGTI